MVKCLTRGLRGFNGAVQRRLATLTVTMLISSCWQLSSEVELRRIFDVCKRWANSGSHEFVKKNIVRYMRPHGRFAHCSCKNAVRQTHVLASRIEIYYFVTIIPVHIGSVPRTMDNFKWLKNDFLRIVHIAKNIRYESRPWPTFVVSSTQY